MGLEVYYPQDIRNALLAAEQATNAAAEFGEVSAGYLTGYRAALATIALAFGLESPAPVPAWRIVGVETQALPAAMPADETTQWGSMTD